MFESGVLSFNSGGGVTTVGGESLFSNGGDDSMYVDSSAGGS